MNKAELIEAIAKEAKLSKADAGRALDGFTNSVRSSLKGGEKITLVGFGTFSVADRAARKGKNPQNGAVINIPAKRVVKFKPGSDLAKSVDK